MKTATFRVLDMHCSACAITLEGLEDELAGVRRASASYHRQTLEVEYDEMELSGQKIVEAASELGYTLVPT